MIPWLLMLLSTVELTIGLRHLLTNVDDTGSVGVAALEAVLTSTSQPPCSVLLVTDGATTISSLYQSLAELPAAGSVAVFEVAADLDANTTQTHLSRVINQARQVRREAWCVTVVTASDDPAFLTSVVESAQAGSLLLWRTRLLVLTRLPSTRFDHLYYTLSTTSSIMLTIITNSITPRCSVYFYHPYCPGQCSLVLLATWDPNRGLVLTSRYPLFPEKFQWLHYRPTLVLGVAGYRQKVEVADPSVPGGKKLVIKDVRGEIVEVLANTINFICSYKSSADGLFGAPQPDGSWSGFVGMLISKEIDLLMEHSGINLARWEVVDFTPALAYTSLATLARVGSSEVDPWGFVLPLNIEVWGMMILVVAVMNVIVACSPLKGKNRRETDIPDIIRVLLQQDIQELSVWWLWQRVLVGQWMMAMLVLTRSYAGNLMSLLAVRHVPMPYQSLRDVLDDPSTTMLWEEATVHMHYVRSTKSGIYKEVADGEALGRVKTTEISNIYSAVSRSTLDSKTVLVYEYAAQHYHKHSAIIKTGRCDFYSSKERFLSRTYGFMGQKGSPLMPAINRRIMQLQYSGLNDYWVKRDTAKEIFCRYLPSKIPLNSALSLSNLWGMFVVLGGGLGAGVLVIGVEMLTHAIRGQ